ncbi:MAG: alpha/beta hydrolase [Proteobacteria bacterium]|nr:alpha/beta hydrolase [Pseudomonadota bacterium]
MFEGFTKTQIETKGATINLVHGGSGPPLLLLHGNPFNYVMWHKIAPELARDFTVVAADLRGYGDSSKPDGGADHAAYSFRAMADDQVEVMASLGFDSFFLAGHDRGARVSHRLALDHPDKVVKLSLIDIVPTHTALTELPLGWVRESYHWFFLAQPYDYPERLICADLEYYMRKKLDKKGVGLSPFTEEAMAEYIRCCTPEQIHGVCEDYRATLAIDFPLDSADFGTRKIACPVQALWGESSHVQRHFKPMEAWSGWADDLRGKALPSGHYPAEQCPEETYDELYRFFSGREET